MEDYNTATLPHEKFFDLTRWHAKEMAKAAKDGSAAQQVRMRRVALP